MIRRHRFIMGTKPISIPAEKVCCDGKKLALYIVPHCKFPTVASPEQVKVLIAALPATVRPPVIVVAPFYTFRR